MIWIGCFFFMIYTGVLVSFYIGFKAIPEFKVVGNTPKISFSVIIPFRNEANSLPELLDSISKIDYPNCLVNFLFVDDDSSDSSVKIIQNFIDQTNTKNIVVLKNKRSSNSPKKDAITTAIAKAKHEWIVTTDADCLLPCKWLQSFNDFIITKQPKMVVAPVNYRVDGSFFEHFQLLDFLSLQGVTIGSFGIDSPFLCNGANLAYRKEDFLRLNGFDNNNQIASGDDVFLLESFIKSHKKKVYFLKSKDAIVTTFPVNNWNNLIHQRVRWAAKTSKFSFWFAKLIGFLILLINLLLVGLFLSVKLRLFGLFLCFKLLIDLLIFIPTINFYRQKNGFLKYYISSSFLYPFFSVFVVLKSLIFTYTWKERRFKK